MKRLHKFFAVTFLIALLTIALAATEKTLILGMVPSIPLWSIYAAAPPHLPVS